MSLALAQIRALFIDLDGVLWVGHQALPGVAEFFSFLDACQIRYVLVYPESGDLVIAGPAADWKPNNEGRMVSAQSGRPVLHLDDLIVIWRHLHRTAGNTFGCSITPTQRRRFFWAAWWTGAPNYAPFFQTSVGAIDSACDDFVPPKIR